MMGFGVRTAGRLTLCTVVVALTLAGQQSAGTNKLGVPNPSKPDVPYLIHGSDIQELEVLMAQRDETKNQTIYWLPGTSASTRTPLAGPEFLMDSQDIHPRDLELYRFEVSKGRRELLYRNKKKVVAQPFFLHLEAVQDRVARIRVNASLEPGEYGLTPEGSDSVFVFSVF